MTKNNNKKIQAPPTPAQKPFGGVPELMEKHLGDGSQSFDPSVFEPPAEEVLLPSKGVFYDDEHNKVIKDNKGKILIRPMTFKEESMLTNPRLVKTGQLLSAILRSTIKTPGVDVEYLLSADRVFLFYYLRSISYGDNYSFTTVCPFCQETINHSVRLGSLNVKYADEKDKEPIEINLPIMKKKVFMRFSRGIDERTESAMQGQEEIEEDIISSYIKLAVDVEGVPRIYWRKFFENLTAKDSATLRNVLTEKEPGIDTTIKMKCPFCNNSFEEALPLTANFFRPE